MAKRALVFPGQGSQYIGMAKDIFENSAKAKELMQKVEDAINFKISKVMFDGPVDELKLTSITQPAIFLHSILLFNELNGIKFDVVAGHSLGEYSALVANKSVDAIEAFKLVRKRGEAMLDAGVKLPGTMAAIIGMDADKLENICSEISNENVVQCANFNSPGQIVISGSIEGVKKAMVESKENGAKLAKELVVSGAFHSPLMVPAVESFSPELENVQFNDVEIPHYANVTAEPVLKNGNQTKELLVKQLTAPVRWEATIKNMIRDGVNEFIEVGPGKVLQGLIKRIDSSVEIKGVDKFDDLNKIL